MAEGFHSWQTLVYVGFASVMSPHAAEGWSSVVKKEKPDGQEKDEPRYLVLNKPQCFHYRYVMSRWPWMASRTALMMKRNYHWYVGPGSVMCFVMLRHGVVRYVGTPILQRDELHLVFGVYSCRVNNVAFKHRYTYRSARLYGVIQYNHRYVFTAGKNLHLK
jgi:hypothetical protein